MFSLEVIKMAMSEQFSLRWNDFHANIAQSFPALLEDEDLVDVTLSAGGQNVRAHKLILSVGSPYFKELFKTTPCSHPVVILKDVAHKELRQLLQFMYRGEVNVCQQELSSFLHTAELLQVKGLTGGREQSESPKREVEAEIKGNINQDSVQDADWLLGAEETIPEVVADLSENYVVKEEAIRSPLKRLLKNTTSRKNDSFKKKQRSTNDHVQQVENAEIANDCEPVFDFEHELMQNPPVLPETTKDPASNCKPSDVKCPSCNRYFANRYNLKVHIRDKHAIPEGTLTCDICKKRMRNPSCLRVHLYNHRKQAAYLAQYCTKEETYPPGYLTKVCPISSNTPMFSEVHPPDPVNDTSETPRSPKAERTE